MGNNLQKYLTMLSKQFTYAFLLQLFLCTALLANTENAQRNSIKEVRVSLNSAEQSLDQFLKQMESKMDFNLTYTDNLVDLKQPIEVVENNKSLPDVLVAVSMRTNLNSVMVNENTHLKVEMGNSEDKAVKVISQADIIVKGVVKDKSGEPFPGVTVLVKGTSIGAATDLGGRYTLTVPEGATLVFSFVGFTTQEFIVGNQSTIDVTLNEDETSLDEVVVVGYGTQKQRDVTGSIATINMARLEDNPSGQASQRLQGQLAGVQINQSSGIPGQGLSIRIRGAASINAGNNPLYVIDGFPVNGGLETLNPNEIENISVLKGSSASALYGSRASNGVVLITTKKALKDQTIVKINVNAGVSEVPQKGRADLMNSKEFLAHSKAFWEDKIRYEGYTGGVPELYQNPEAWTGPDTDWFDVLLQTAYRKSYNVSLLSNKGKFSSSTIVGYFKEDGAVINSGYKRYSIRNNNEYEINDNIRVGFNVAPTYQISNNLNAVDGGQFNMVYAATVTPPIFSPDETNPDGSPVLSFSGPGLFTFPNWKKTAREQTNTSKEFRVLSSMYAEVDFLKNFQFRSSVSVDFNNRTGRTFFPSTIGPIIWNSPPRLATGSYGTSNSILWLTENNLSFTKTYATNHNINALVGYSAQAFNAENSRMQGNQFSDDLVPWLDAAANLTAWGNGLQEWSLLSMYGRLNYDYKYKYLLSLSFRRDGSSRFGAANRWANFPSVSAGWIISDENFAEEWSVVNFLKLRAEYGESGNFNIGNYSQFGNLLPRNYVFGSTLAAGRSQSSIGNNNLTWETTSGTGIGVDLEVFKNRVAFTYDYYNKSTKGLLFQIDIPWASGFPNIQDNIGEFHFWGHEFALNTKNFVGDFKWNTNINFSLNRNKVIKLGTNDAPIGANDFWSGNTNRTVVGHPIGMFYGFVTDGVYMTQEEFATQPKHSSSAVGSERYKDLNGDGILNGDDRTFIGNPNADFNYGITNSFSYKNWDMNIVIIGAQGGDRIRTILEWSQILEGNFNVEKYVGDRWRSIENPGAGRIGRTLSGTTEFNDTAQSGFVEDASYLSINNILLGYTLPKIKNVGNARVFVSAQNALLLTNYGGPNPQASRMGLNGLREGIDDSGYPIARTFTVGMDFTF